MLAPQFSEVFRQEHRKVRDALLDLAEAFQARDKARISTLLGEIATFTGPHFRYEEEALYPSLVTIFGVEYVEKLLGDHDGAIGTAKALIDLAGHEPLADEDVTRAVRLVRTVLPHVSDCDGLSIMVERLPDETISGSLMLGSARSRPAWTWPGGRRRCAAGKPSRPRSSAPTEYAVGA